MNFFKSPYTEHFTKFREEEAATALRTREAFQQELKDAAERRQNDYELLIQLLKDLTEAIKLLASKLPEPSKDVLDSEVIQ